MIRVVPELADGRLIVLADAGEHDAAIFQSLQGFMQAEVIADIGEIAGNLRRPGERTAGLGQNPGQSVPSRSRMTHFLRPMPATVMSASTWAFAISRSRA